ncbi:bifunctional aminoglycoside phosphotransferase/ATP-binding protein [Rhodohalobacter sp. 8-1]|uniref:bifunctional aminoglycoside phosphotransferase/ATP-binding protein n=1 Tax=Rhodohalobacter sp. 8-1 TaxID=3131972 RepID=UPI0030EE5269
MQDSNSKTGGAKQIIDFLKNRESYPHSPEAVQHIQTHISNVFMVPPFVYKIKKRVDFGFLDYSTLDKRRHFCEQEVELNRRLCSDIYLGVESIAKSENGLKIVSEDPGNSGEEIVEYAVKMKMLEEKYFLHSYIDRNKLSNEHLDRVADKLSEFYLEQSPDESVKVYGDREKIRYNTDENFSQTEAFIGETISREAFEAIQYFTDTYLETKTDLFEKRVEEDRIVDGHGDLHLEHIHVNPKGVCIYDCIEFNERLRCGDQAVDLAFLAMDLDYNDLWGFGRYFVDTMSRKLNDPELTTIIDFYKCYRAYVKGKVKSIKSAEEDVEKEDRIEAAKIASVYFKLSLRYSLIGSRPIVLICMGRIGTGKSTLATHLGDTLDVDVFSSDQIRKEMAGLPLNERPDSETRKKLYSAEMSRKTYQKLTDHAIQSIQSGRSAILDATFSQRSGRRDLIEELESVGADYIFIEAQATDEVVKSRLKDREGDNETVSDARLEDFDMLTKKYYPPSEIKTGNKIEVDTGTNLRVTIENLYQKMVDRQVGLAE